MLGFMVLFFGAVIWACSRRRKPHFDRMAHLPLEDFAHDAGHHEEIRNG
ncbi:MAG: cbb3-type cytochrome c oxidase subunit 3 [Planctomycetes bacterium]|nr:cbb3-type cytochrome c oxidase subunit 3 [Planctomycetota bacterium]